MTDPVVRGPQFAAFDAGAWKDLGAHVFDHPRLGPVPGKLFLKDLLGLTGMEVSLGRLPAGVSVPFHHRHREHEELYIVVQGRGQIQVDGRVIDVREGSVVRIAPGGVHAWRSAPDEALVYLVVQAKDRSWPASTIEDGEPLADPVRWPVHR